MKPINLASALVLAAALVTPTFAYADDKETVVRGVRSDGAPVAYVKYRDLNLGTPEGVKALNDRVRRVANSMCMPNGVHDLRTKWMGWECRDIAIASAKPQIARVVENYSKADYASLPEISVKASN